MAHGYADPEQLDDASRRALEIAADVLTEEWSRVACRLRTDDVLDPHDAMGQHLPAKRQLRYTRPFAFDMLGALHVVLHRLASRADDAPTCTSTAQELAFRALVETAAIFLDEGADDQALRDFYEDHVEDTDIDLLFDPAFDGLEDPAEHPTTTPPVNLAFDRWFEPFGGAWPAVGAG